MARDSLLSRGISGENGLHLGAPTENGVGVADRMGAIFAQGE
jgi:hypothetical protein